ncbi:DUF6009 family protein [Streptomyces sp. NBC_00069]|uniref:DUF6009 family protein n=1 Tax=Streptomyces sp. NBC_00069 TaxID=2975639 RepID=UPI003254FF26|nr:DUF6009 family protein [Streptomyces sp. NBC_00998]
MSSVGYALLKGDAPNNSDTPGTFSRRVFWVKEHDRSEQPAGTYSSGAPTEAVDPRTVTPRTPGELTERAWGGKISYPVARQRLSEPLATGPPQATWALGESWEKILRERPLGAFRNRRYPTL